MHGFPDRRCLPTALALLACSLAGCDKGDPGPKRADHEAAHARRYHPEVPRADVNGTPATAPAGKAAVTQPSDITFAETGAVGCPVLFVNGESLTVQEILEPILPDLAEKSHTLPLDAYRTYVFRVVGNQIEYAVSMVVVHQQAKEEFKDEKIQEAFDKEADRLVKDVINRRFGGVSARYEAHLKALDLKLDDIKARAKRQAMVSQFLHDRFKPIAVEPSRRELVQYYNTHPDEFSTSPRAQLLLIEVPLEKELGKPLSRATPAEIAAARSRARSQLVLAREELARGVPFADVARKYCKGIRAGLGGDWGEISPGAMTGRMTKPADVLFTLKQNQVSDITESEDALFIVKCGASTPGHKSTFEEAQEKIIDRLAEQRFNQNRDEYVQQLLAKATISDRQSFFEAVLSAVPRPAALYPSAIPQPKR